MEGDSNNLQQELNLMSAGNHGVRLFRLAACRMALHRVPSSAELHAETNNLTAKLLPT
jgi:hypothetical protein